MATYFTDFASYTAGAAPTDWTRRWVTTPGAWTVVAASGFGGTKNGLQSNALGNNRNAFTWNAIDNDTARGNVEVLYRWTTAVTTGTHDGRCLVRASGAVGAEIGYRIGLSNGFKRIEAMNGATVTTPFSSSPTTYVAAPPNWYWTRVRVNGTNLRLRHWTDGTAEPTTWDADVTDSAVTGAGWVGLFQAVTGTTTVDQFGVGTGGDTAPSTAASQLTASAGPDVTTSAGSAVTLAGTEASSAGTIASRAWTALTYPGTAAPTLTGATTATATFTPVAGEYTFRYRVTDSAGGVAEDTTTVYARAVGEARPFATPSAGEWTAVGAASIHVALSDEVATTYAETADNPKSASFVVDVAPTDVGGKTINYTLANSNGVPTGTVLVEYLSAGRVVASWNETVTGTTAVTQSRALTDAQNALVTDPLNHQLRFTGTV